MNNLITDLLELAATKRTETYSFEEKNIKIDYQIKDTKKIKLVSFNITN